MTAVRVDFYGKHRIEVRGTLALAVAASAADADLCPLCNAHPSSGHGRDCPLVADAIEKGAALAAEPEDD